MRLSASTLADLNVAYRILSPHCRSISEVIYSLLSEENRIGLFNSVPRKGP